MGNCVASVMDRKDRSMMVDHQQLAKVKAYGAQGYAIPNTQQQNCSAIYRMSHLTDEQHEQLKHDYYHDLNMVQMMEQFCAKFGDRRALGYRDIERTEKKVVVDALGKKKLFDHYYCSPCKTISYKEMWNKMQTFSRGLSTLGVKPRDVISIYEETRWEWLVTAYAIWMQDMIVSTVYANLGQDALAYALRQTQSKVIVCNGKSLRTLLKILSMKQLHPILVYLDDIAPDIDLSGFTAIPWQSIMNEGERLPHVKLTIQTNNDAQALIMYTSGTTGDPKGVIHTFGSITAGIRSFKQRLDEIFRPSEPDDTYCAYLPLAHILQFAIVNLILARGGMIGFGSPRTLTDLNTSPHGDLKEYNACILIGVPRIYDTIRKGIEAKLPPIGSFKRTVFDRAFQSRLRALKEGKDTPYWNDKVFSNVRQLLGAKMFGMLSGGGPLSASTQDYLNVVFGGPPIIQGWGLTQTISCGTTQRVGDMTTNCAGQIVNAGEVRLLDTSEYKHTDKPQPRGEICLRGPFVFKGYYKQPQLTREALDSEGWFHTGDVGSITEDGKLRIIGRIKALAKNALGEYIALEALQAIYNNNHLVLPGCICVVVDPSKTYICAIALTDAVRCAAFAKEHNLKGQFPQILCDAKFQEAAAASLVQTAKSANRKPFECVKRVRILNDEWTAENGLVTPTSKVRRCNIDIYYKDMIKEMFVD